VNPRKLADLANRVNPAAVGIAAYKIGYFSAAALNFFSRSATPGMIRAAFS
jgi:hypothetical protein